MPVSLLMQMKFYCSARSIFSRFFFINGLYLLLGGGGGSGRQVLHSIYGSFYPVVSLYTTAFATVLFVSSVVCICDIKGLLLRRMSVWQYVGPTVRLSVCLSVCTS